MAYRVLERGDERGGEGGGAGGLRVPRQARPHAQLRGTDFLNR